MHTPVPEPLIQKLAALDQEILISYWNQLSFQEQEQLSKQIQRIDLSGWQRLQKARLKPFQPVLAPYDTITPITYSEINSHMIEAGHRAIGNGAIGCLVVAGGQGTRLGFNGPKGAYPLTPKSLFELLTERIASLQALYNRELPFAIMTSPLNDEATKEFFQTKNLFDLTPQVEFFSQGMLPLMTKEGDLFLTPSAELAEGPDGNGMALSAFYHSGMWQRWMERGVKSVMFMQIDNPLADPYDAAFVGVHLLDRNDITIKCVSRRDALEAVGVLVSKENRLQVIEYSEIDPKERAATLSSGLLKHSYANISLFCFSMPFIQAVATDYQQQLPLHLAQKQAAALTIQDSRRDVETIKALKGEAFIFDVLPYAKHIQVVHYPREICFAPLKNQTGNDSPETVIKALQEQLPHLL